MGVNNSLLKSIQTIVDKAIEIAPFDKTRQAQIITNNGDGSYTVRLDGILYNNVPSYPKTNVLEVGSIVKIVMPSNQSSQMYIQSSKGGGGGGSGDHIGEIKLYAGNIEPTGWLKCDGRAISRIDYAALFDVIGTTYGAGDGSTTFNLPDMRDRFPVGAGSNYNLNSKGGEDSVTLTDLEIAHGHGFTAPTVGGGATTSEGMSANAKHSHSFTYAQYGRQTGSSTTSALQYTGSTKTTSEADLSHTHKIPAHSHTLTGGGVANLGGTSADRTAHENRPPYIGINFLIYVGMGTT